MRGCQVPGWVMDRWMDGRMDGWRCPPLISDAVTRGQGGNRPPACLPSRGEAWQGKAGLME